MRKILLIATMLGGAIISGGTICNAASGAGFGMTIYGNAPTGHLQPRAQQFAPRSPAEQAEQQQQSIYDAQQQRLDEELDQHLNICRGC